MHRGARGIALVAFVTTIIATPAGALEPPTGWDGSNPFRCELQQAGLTAVVPDPDADPFCVEFDKRRQNVTELGVVDFLLLEPARVAAAVPVCFYFQSDHWRGSLVQEDGTTKTYEFDGHYFFDKARAEGGAWVTNFNVAGQTFDPAQIPGIPAEYSRYLGPGTGGVITRNDIPADPGCVERAADASRPVYAAPPPGEQAAAGMPAAPVAPCPALKGAASPQGLGPIGLGDADARVRAALGRPARVHRGFLRYCVAGGGKYLVGQAGDRSGEQGSDPQAPTVFLFTTSATLRVGEVGRGSSTRLVARTFPRARRRTSMGRTRVLETSRGSGVLLGVRDGRVRFVAVHDRKLVRSTAAVRSYLRRAQ
jgi:hypothetical protein